MSNLYVNVVTSDTTTNFNSDTYLIDASSSDITVTLIDATQCSDGANFILTRIDSNSSNTVTIDPNGVNVNGHSTPGQLDITENVRLVVSSNNWYTVHGKYI